MARTRTNKENKPLPKNWRYRAGAYRYRVPKNERHLWGGKSEPTLGTTLPEAHRTWAKHIEEIEAKGAIITMADALDEYAARVVPLKKLSSQRGQAGIVAKLRGVFGPMLPEDIEPHHAYTYFEKRTAKTAAKRELEVLSHCLTKLVEWGRLRANPMLGQVRLSLQSKPQDYVTDDQVISLLLIQGPKTGGLSVVQAYVRLKLLTGLRRTDMLRLRVSDIREDGLSVLTSKTGKPLLIEITPELRRELDNCKSVRPVISPYLFCTRDGAPYIKEDASADGWESLWQRAMAKVTAAGGEKFKERALRNKAGSDAETLEHASALLAHADKRTTNRFYRLKAETVKPFTANFEKKAE